MILCGSRFALVVVAVARASHRSVGLWDLLHARISVHTVLVGHRRGCLVVEVPIVSVCIGVDHGYVGLESLLLVQTLQVALCMPVLSDDVSGNLLVACCREPVVPARRLANLAGFGRARQISLLRALFNTVFLDLLYVLSKLIH